MSYASNLKYYTDTRVDGGNGETDISKLISNAMIDGKSGNYVQALLDQRNEKIKNNPGLSQYANDDFTRQAEEYIKSKSNDTNTLTDSLRSVYSSGYTTAYNNAKKANDAAVNKAVNDLNAQKASTDQSYANLFRQLYLDKMKAKKNVNQQLASQGITGGMSESSLLGLDTSYGEALRQGEQERIRTQAELDKAITDTKLTGDVETANAALELAQRGTDSYAGVLQSLINRNDTLDYNKSVIERENDAIAREQENNERINARSWAMTLLQNGIMPSSDVLLSAGINTADAQAVVDSVKAQQKSASSVTSTMSLTDARNALEAGYIDDNIRTVLKNNGWSDAYIDYVYGADVPTESERSNLKQGIINSGLADVNGTISATDWDYIIENNPGVTEDVLLSLGFSKGVSSADAAAQEKKYNTSFVGNLSEMINDPNTEQVNQNQNNNFYYTPYTQQSAPDGNPNLLTYNATKLLNGILTSQKARGDNGITEAEKNQLLVSAQRGMITENDWLIIKNILGL